MSCFLHYSGEANLILEKCYQAPTWLQNSQIPAISKQFRVTCICMLPPAQSLARKVLKHSHRPPSASASLHSHPVRLLLLLCLTFLFRAEARALVGSLGGEAREEGGHCNLPPAWHAVPRHVDDLIYFQFISLCSSVVMF